MKKHRLLIYLLVIMMIGAMAFGMGCAPEDPEVPEEPEEPVIPEEPEEPEERDVFTGEAEGAHDMVYVEVTMEDGLIVDIDVEHNETEEVVDPAFDELIPQIIENQSTEGIDVVSGATYSSEALFEAVEDALAKAE